MPSVLRVASHSPDSRPIPTRDVPKPLRARVAPDTSPATFRRDGPLWTMGFGGVSVRLTHQKGFLDLAQLLARPGVELHCLELADRPAEPAGDAPMLDDRARRELKARVRDLQREIDDADAACDLGRAEAAREELDRIVEHLSDAVGLGGRARHLGSAAERARSAVTWRIRSAIRKVAATHPRLGRHSRERRTHGDVLRVRAGIADCLDAVAHACGVEPGSDEPALPSQGRRPHRVT